MCVGESGARTGQGIEIRSWYARIRIHRAHVSRTKVIGKNEDDVGLVIRSICCRWFGEGEEENGGGKLADHECTLYEAGTSGKFLHRGNLVAISSSGIICESDVRAALVWLSGSDVRQEEPGMFSQGKAREAGTGVGWRPGEEPWLYPH